MGARQPISGRYQRMNADEKMEVIEIVAMYSMSKHQVICNLEVPSCTYYRSLKRKDSQVLGTRQLHGTFLGLFSFWTISISQNWH